MGAKTLSVWMLLGALVAAPVLAQDDAGWSARRAPGALPPANPDEGLELLVPPVPDMPPMPAVPAIPGIAALGGLAGAIVPVAKPAEPRPDDPPVVQIMQPQWNGWSGGVGLMILKPYVSNNPAYSVAAPVGGGGFVGQTASFTYDPQPAVQFWIAYDDPAGWGGRFRSFVFDADSNGLGVSVGSAVPVVTVPAIGPILPGAPVFGAPSPVLTAGLGRDFLDFTSDLRIASTDLEGTYGYMSEDFSIQGSAGLRCLYLRQEYAATLVNPGDGITTFAQQLRAEREFSGCGPTASLFGRYRLGCSPVALYAGVRGSVVYGRMETTSRFAQVVTDPGAVAGGSRTVLAGVSSRSDHTLPVTELEFGCEYGAMAGRYGFFVRTGLVSQTYWDAGGATGSSGNLSLIGGQIAVGFAY
jgi:hypothetical protein